MLHLNQNLSCFAEVCFYWSGFLEDLGQGITVKPAATPLVGALGIVPIGMLVVIVDLVVPRVSYT